MELRDFGLHYGVREDLTSSVLAGRSCSLMTRHSEGATPGFLCSPSGLGEATDIRS